MGGTKLLVISDVPEWTGYVEAVKRHSPELILLVGDVVHDGWVNDRPTWMSIPEYRAFWERYASPVERQAERAGDGDSARAGLTIGGQEFAITHPKGLEGFWDEEEQIKKRLEQTGAFLEAYLGTHVRGFYDFLSEASKLAPVLSVRGDHDSERLGYHVDRIESTSNVHEITGSAVEAGGLRVAGLGFPFNKPITRLKEMAADTGTGMDILACHWEHKHLPRIEEILQPRLIIKGHFGGGLYLLNGTPVVFTEKRHHVVLEVDAEGTCKVDQYQLAKGAQADGKIRFDSVESWDTVAMFAERPPEEMWPWMEKHASRIVALGRRRKLDSLGPTSR